MLNTLTTKIILAGHLVLWPLLLRAAPDEIRMGLADGYPVCQSIINRMECRVGSFSHAKGRKVARAQQTKYLKKISAKKDEINNLNYLNEYLEAYLNQQKTTGLLIIKNGEIIFEKYQYERDKSMQMRAFSMSKTIIAILIGIAHQKGFIHSLDDIASKYYKDLEGSEYGATTIRNLLQMSSGVKFTEEYSGNKETDFVKFNSRLNDVSRSNRKSAEAFTLFNHREFKQGTRFNYASIETEVLCRILKYSTRSSISALTEQWLWLPMGAESEGYWLLNGTEADENCGGGFLATVRDYGRLGILLANDGAVGEQQVIPRDYLMLATNAKSQREAFKPKRATSYLGYGYQTWIFPMEVRAFGLIGIYGQSLFVQPASGIVMVETGVYDMPSDQQALRKKMQLWKFTLDSLGGFSKE